MDGLCMLREMPGNHIGARSGNRTDGDVALFQCWKAILQGDATNRHTMRGTQLDQCRAAIRMPCGDSDLGTAHRDARRQCRSRGVAVAEYDCVWLSWQRHDMGAKGIMESTHNTIDISVVKCHGRKIPTR